MSVGKEGVGGGGGGGGGGAKGGEDDGSGGSAVVLMAVTCLICYSYLNVSLFAEIRN